MKKFLFTTNDSYAPTILRVLLGTMLFGHGAQKLMGWFGGYGFEGTMAYFTGTAGLPWIVGLLVILLEFFGSVLLILGFATRIWSTAMLFLFAGIALMVHLPNGFYMNWEGTQKGEGIEFFLLAIGMAASLTITGAGKLSIDRTISEKNSANSQLSATTSFHGEKRRVA